MKNYVKDAMVQSLLRKQERTKEEIENYDSVTTRMIFILTYLDDTICMKVEDLCDDIKGTKLYRFNKKYLLNQMVNECSVYQNRITKVMDFEGTRYYDILGSFNEVMDNCITRYYMVMSDILEERGVTGLNNKISSKCLVIEMLASTVKRYVVEIDDYVYKFKGIRENWMHKLNMEVMVKFSSDLADEFVAVKDNIVLESYPKAYEAYSEFCKTLLSASSFKKALEENDNLMEEFL